MGVTFKAIPNFVGTKTIPVYDPTDIEQTTPIGEKTINVIDETAFYTAVVEECFSLNQDVEAPAGVIELTIYFKASDPKGIYFTGGPLNITEEEQFIAVAAEAGYTRLGTMQNITYDMIPTVRLVDDKLGVYEIDDGEDTYYNYNDYKHLVKFQIKRTMIDSSFGLTTDVMAYYRKLLQYQNGLIGMVERANQSLNPEEIIIEVPPPSVVDSPPES